MTPKSLFFIFVGYERIIEPNISISYIPVHSSIILSATLLGRNIVSPSIITVFIPAKLSILLDVDVILNIPIMGKSFE